MERHYRHQKELVQRSGGRKESRMEVVGGAAWWRLQFMNPRLNGLGFSWSEGSP